MKEKQLIPEELIRSALEIFGFGTDFGEITEYINWNGEYGENLVKVIFSVSLSDGQRVVIKILREDEDFEKEHVKIEKQSAFSEFMRESGILTPMRYRTGDSFCGRLMYGSVPCHVTTEDWCGEEIAEITAELAYRIGELMARMHVLSLENHCGIGSGTLFSAAEWNDVDSFEEFCKLSENTHLDQETARKIRELHDEKLNALRAVWDTLPKSAVQGDISVNNLTDTPDGLTVFDYNNAGDVVLISDLVLEGLLTAYEMDLPAGIEPAYRETLFPAFLDGYLSVRKLSEEEADAAWITYTLYHALWFSRIVYNENSLQKLIGREDYDEANRLLEQMLHDMTEADDGRFRR